MAACARCLTPTPASSHAVFGYEGTSYELDLCERHAEMFDRDMIGWLRIASEVGMTHKPVLSNGQRPAPQPRIEADEPEPDVVRVPEISARALGFHFTAHAQHRMKVRKIGPTEVYRLIDDYSKVRRPGNEEGTHVYLGDDLRVVVNEERRSILTVARRQIGEASGSQE